MKKYLLFAGDAYYPSGGWDDFVESYDSLEEAVARGKLDWKTGQWWHVVADGVEVTDFIKERK